MPKYYRYGYQQPKYAFNRGGLPVQSQRAASTRGLGDVTNTSHRIDLVPSEDPYLLHKKYYQRPFHFAVPEADSPYYTHKYGAVGAMGPSNTEMSALKIAAATAAAWFLLIKKGAPLRKKVEGLLK